MKNLDVSKIEFFVDGKKVITDKVSVVKLEIDDSIVRRINKNIVKRLKKKSKKLKFEMQRLFPITDEQWEDFLNKFIDS